MNPRNCGENTWPPKKNHTMGLREMWRDYRRKMAIKFREDRTQKQWKNKLPDKEYIAIIFDLFKEIETTIVEKRRPIHIPRLGTFRLEKRKNHTVGQINVSPETRKKRLLGIHREFNHRLVWDRGRHSVDNAKYYRFKFNDGEYSRTRGKVRLRKL